MELRLTNRFRPVPKATGLLGDLHGRKHPGGRAEISGIWILSAIAAGVLFVATAVIIQRADMECARTMLEATGLAAYGRGEHAAVLLEGSGRIRTAVLDDSLKVIRGGLDVPLGLLRPAAALALKTGAMVSRGKTPCVLVPAGRHVLALEAQPRSIKEVLAATWPLYLLFFALLALIGLLSRRLCPLKTRVPREFLLELEGIAGGGRGSGTPEELVERLREQREDMEQRILAAEGELQRCRDETKRLERALRKASQDLKGIQDDIIQAGTLTALGEFAAGMSHELNNPLGIVLGFTQHLLEELPEGTPHHPKLKRMETELGKCQKIIQDLLSFARPAQPRLQPVEVNALVKDVVHLWSYNLPGGIELRCRPNHRALSIQADPEQLEQVLLNLLRNAADAMPEGGTLEISTSMVQLSMEDCLNLSLPAEQPGGPLPRAWEKGGSIRTPMVNELLEPGSPAVAIQVKDTGKGMDRETLQKIFTPFFTTKKRHGTGLGLSICWKLVRKNHGIIKVESERGKGTAFSLIFPVIQAEDRR